MPRLALLAAFAALALPAQAADGAAGPRPRDVAVYRPGDAGAPSAVRVHRGSAAPPAAPRAELAPAIELVGGDRLWLVDPGRHRLVACRLTRSATVGRDRIRCAESRLPTS